MKWVYILLFAGLITFRFSYLDQDAPGYQLANICQEDEPYYSLGAMFKFCASQGRTVKGFETNNMEGLDMYNRMATYTSLKVFGNNYWGLRIPDVMASLLFALLIYSIFKTLNPANEFRGLIMSLLFTNFYIFVFSRYNNPQIFSVLIITFTLWLVTRFGYQKPLPLIALGFATAFAVLFVYIMNFFLLVGIGTFILIRTIALKNIKLPVYFALGIGLCTALFLFGLHIIGSSFSMIYHEVMGYSSSNNVLIGTKGASSIFGNVINSFVSILSTGFFRFQLPLLLGFLIAIPILLFNMLNRAYANRNIALLVICIVGFQVLQNYFALSYPFKKMLVDLPVVLIMLFLAIGDIDLKLFKSSALAKIGMGIYVLIAVALCLFVFKTTKSPQYWSYKGVGCFTSSPLWFDTLNIGACVILVVNLLYTLFFTNKYNTALVKMVFMVSIFANALLVYVTFVKDRKYQVRDSLVSLAPMLHDKVVIGAFPLACQFYTGCKPALDWYNHENPNYRAVFDSMMVNKKADYTIAKVMPGKPETADTNLTLVKVYNFDCYSYYVYKNKTNNLY